MKRTLIPAAIAILASSLTFAANPIQRIDVVNMLWNPNGTSGVAGLSPTSVIVAFNNGGVKPCSTTTLAFQGAVTVLAGTGQACVAAITSVTITPVAGPAGTVYSALPDTPITSSHYTTQIMINNKIDPIFDSTNGAIKTQGVAQTIAQGQLALD
jgi:hypothetical protein